LSNEEAKCGISHGWARMFTRLYLCLRKPCASKPGNTTLWRNLLMLIQPILFQPTNTSPCTANSRSARNGRSAARTAQNHVLVGSPGKALTLKSNNGKSGSYTKQRSVGVIAIKVRRRVAIQDSAWCQCNSRRGCSPWGTLPPISTCGVRSNC
jgi:hypothetical protein